MPRWLRGRRPGPTSSRCPRKSGLRREGGVPIRRDARLQACVSSCPAGPRRPPLERTNALRLETLGALLGFEVDLLSFDELAVAGAFDRREVGEDVGRAVVRGDESKALGGVEPLHGACC